MTAVLASIPLSLVDDAISVLPARIGQLLPNRPLEEPFAPFATENIKASVSTITKGGQGRMS